MNAENKITAEVKDDVISISGKREVKITFLGSSCSASVHPLDKVDSFCLSPSKSEAVVAIKTSELVGRDTFTQCCLLLVWQIDGKPWINLEGPFMPSEDRIGQIVENVGLSVRIEHQFFLAPVLVSPYHSESARAEIMKDLRTKYRLVSVEDANLLCRFMAGTAEAKEVIAAAENLVSQTVDVPAVRKQIAEMMQQLDVVQKKELEHQRQLEECQRVIGGLRANAEITINHILAIMKGTDLHERKLFDTNGAKLKRIKDFLSDW